MFLVEFMPVSLRESHTAAGNSGRYPQNGALRVVCDYRPDVSEWVEILREATEDDITNYGLGDVE